MQPIPATTSTDVAELDDTAAPRPSPLLLVLGRGQLATYRVPTVGEVVLGRDPGCGIVLADRSISRQHARIRASVVRSCAAVVEDLRSTNGVTVRGQRLAPGTSAALDIGDSFQIGGFTAVVMATDDARAESDSPRAAIDVADPTPLGVSEVVARIAPSPASVLILGETGAGKEVLAHTLHELSGRPGPFVGINSAALGEHLLESELFGHERGAFTGANHTKLGLLETAPHGTVFLDEIGDLPPALQAKLLRALETRELYRVGGIKPIAFDVRFLAATHRDLDAEVAAGRFRRDLYYRINGITLRVRPLRERRDAISELASRFIADAALAAGRRPPQLAVEALMKLARHDWPGNVRELRAVIERALLVCTEDRIGPAAILIDNAAVIVDSPAAFLALAQRHRGNVTLIARALATSRSQVHRLARRFSVELDSLRGE
jgi:two-component system, NtrC family, response regulator AtoC